MLTHSLIAKRPAAIAKSITLLAAALVLTTGCANMVTTASPINTFSSPATIMGHVHGGNQAVAFATINLYMAGTTGYGSAGTQLATTTTANDGFGSFSFVKNAFNGPSSVTGNTWACPATAADPQIYIIAQGGTTDGSGDSSAAHTNNAAAFIIAAGPCSGISNATTLDLNEISSAATVFALAQYINPGIAPGTESIGTNGANTATNKPQAAVGLNNSVASIANLANVSTGFPVASNNYTGSNSTTTGITVTATPESSKLITIANIMAACVNNATVPNANCTTLFNNAVPPAAAVTSQPAATFQTAQDVVQAAYYMAVNPALSPNSAQTACGGPSTNVACLFNLTSPQSPFQPNLASAPSDWSIGVTYTASGTCTNGGNFIAGAFKGGVDAVGNLWFVNGINGGANLSELGPLGQPLFCAGNNASGRGLAIDTTGNVWASFSNPTLPGAIQEFPVGGTSLLAWTPTVQPTTLVADGSGNVFYASAANGGTYNEFINPGTTTQPFASIQIANTFNGTATTTLGYGGADPSGRLFIATSTISRVFEAFPGTPATPISITAFQIASNVVTFTANNTLTAGKVVAVTGLSTGTYLNNQSLVVTGTPTATQFQASFTHADVGATSDSGIAQLANTYTLVGSAVPTTAYGIAIASDNSIYQGTTCCSSASGKALLKETPVSAGAITNVSSPLFIGGVNGVRSVTLDGAGNVWAGNEYANSSGATTISGTYSISETTSALAGISLNGTNSSCSTSTGCPTTGGYFKADFNEPLDMDVDPSGNLWVLNSGTVNGGTTSGVSITEVIGVAVPVVTPMSVAAKTSQLATKP